jgi:hypothetical protein
MSGGWRHIISGKLVKRINEIANMRACTYSVDPVAALEVPDASIAGVVITVCERSRSAFMINESLSDLQICISYTQYLVLIQERGVKMCLS